MNIKYIDFFIIVTVKLVLSENQASTYIFLFEVNIKYIDVLLLLSNLFEVNFFYQVLLTSFSNFDPTIK